MIGFSFVFWLVESWPITDRNKVNRPGGFIIYENNEDTFLGKILGSEDASGCQKWAILQEKKKKKRTVWEFKNVSKIGTCVHLPFASNKMQNIAKIHFIKYL